MAKVKNDVTNEVKKVVGVADPDKMAMYDKVAEFVAAEIGGDVFHVKPRSFKDEETGKTKKTGSYGLLFNLNGKLVTLEMVVKADTASEDDFVIEATTTA